MACAKAESLAGRRAGSEWSSAPHVEPGDRELRSRKRAGEVAVRLPEPDVVAEEEDDGTRWSRRVGRTIKEEGLGAEPAVTSRCEWAGHHGRTQGAR